MQKFVAWDKLPTLHPHGGTQESSSSSSKTGSLEEEESEIFQKAKDSESTDDVTLVSFVEIPHSVRNVLNKIDTAQLERAKKDISKKLFHIRDKVNRVYEHYKRDDGFDPELEKEYLHTATWEEKSRRSNLLDEITDALGQSAFIGKELQMVLESLKAWSEMLRTIELQERVIPTEDWIDEAEKHLLKHFHAIQANILYLIKMCYPLLEEREKMKQKSAVKAGIFKAWRDKVTERPHLAEPLTAEQMVEDDVLTFTLTHEVNKMLLELVDVSFFSKGEVNAIKYIAAMVANLTKAFSLVTRQCRSLKIKLEVGTAESRKQDPQITSLQRELRMIIEKKTALEMQVQNAEERCKVLLTTNEAMQKELRSAHERAQMNKTSFARPSVSKDSQEKSKSPVDVQRDVIKSAKPLLRPKLTSSKQPGMEDEESSSLEEMKKLKPELEDGDTENVVPVTTESQAHVTQDGQIKRTVKVREKETAPEIVTIDPFLGKEVLSDKVQQQNALEETAYLGKKPVEKVIEPIKILKGDRESAAQPDSKLYEKTKLQTPQSATAINARRLSQSSGAGFEDSIQPITSERCPSRQASVESVQTPSAKEDAESPAEKLLPKAQGEGRPPKKRLLKQSMKEVVNVIRFQKHVKFEEGVSPQKPLTAPDTSAQLDTDFPEESPSPKTLMGIAEYIESESQDTGEIQEQKEQTGRLKEKKETKSPRTILVERPTDISERPGEKRKHTKVIKEVIHALGTQLQEIARQKGGVIEEETIKELFEELDMTSEEDLAGQVDGSLDADTLAKVLIAKTLELPASETEQLSKSGKSIDEASSGQDIKSAMQEFQASILACIEDKLETLKPFPSGSLKQVKKSKPTDPQALHLYQAVDRKLEECFSAMKQKCQEARMRRRISSQGSEEEDKESKLLSSLGTPMLSPESSASSLTFPEEGGEQRPPRHHKLSKQRQEQVRKLQEALWDPTKQQRQKEGLPKPPHPKAEKQAHLLEGVGPWVEKEQEKRQGKELPQAEFLTDLLRQWSLESDSGQGLWFLRLQERLQWEKERLQEEQWRLQEERQRLDDEEQYLGHWQEIFQTQQQQWEQQQQQQREQELLWATQLEHWQQLKRDHEGQQQYWWLQQQQQQERLHQLQEELQVLQRQYEQQLLLQKEQTEEQGRWDQLKAWREEQLRAWQEEDEERERQRRQWQRQVADHEKQMEAWQEEKAEQALQYKRRQERQRQRQQAQDSLWQQRSQEQLERWEHQVQQQQSQQRKWESQQQKVQERQKQIRNEEKALTPKLRRLMAGVQQEAAKQGQRLEPRAASPTKWPGAASPVKREPPARKVDLLPTAHKAGLLPATPQLSPQPSGEYSGAFDTDSTTGPERLPRAGGFFAPGITDKRYSIDVEAQRKNLELLEEVAQKAGFESELHIKAKETIIQVLHSNVERLALLFRKYIAFCHLQEIRQILTARLDAAIDDKDGATMQKLYKFVERLDAYQKKVLGNWTVDQKNVEKQRRRNIENMMVLLAQLRLSSGLQLSTPSPLMIKAASASKETQPMPHIGPVYLRPKVYRSPLFTVKKPIAFSAIVRDQSSEQIESLWKTGITELSIPLGPKTPVSLLWSQVCGFPDIPRFLEFDIASIRNKPLQDIRMRVQNLPRWKLSEYNCMHL